MSLLNNSFGTRRNVHSTTHYYHLSWTILAFVFETFFFLQLSSTSVEIWQPNLSKKFNLDCHCFTTFLLPAVTLLIAITCHRRFLQLFSKNYIIKLIFLNKILSTLYLLINFVLRHRRRLWKYFCIPFNKK